MDKNKYNRAAKDSSQLQQFVDEVCEELKELIDNPTIKTGNYIIDENGNFIWVEEIPEDYSGHSLFIGDDAYFYIEDYTDGVLIGSLEISSQGVAKINFGALTHSFNELDETLQDIIADAISDAGQDGVACSQAQWNVIKELLDNSLYLAYDGTSLIKSSTNGINNYVFGSGSIGGTAYVGYTALEINYAIQEQKLYMVTSEV